MGLGENCSLFYGMQPWRRLRQDSLQVVEMITATTNPAPRRPPNIRVRTGGPAAGTTPPTAPSSAHGLE